MHRVEVRPVTVAYPYSYSAVGALRGLFRRHRLQPDGAPGNRDDAQRGRADTCSSTRSGRGKFMNRRNRHILIVGIAVVTAGLASFGVYRAVTGFRFARLKSRAAYVVVAAPRAASRRPIAATDVRLAAWPAASPVAGKLCAA